MNETSCNLQLIGSFPAARTDELFNLLSKYRAEICDYVTEKELFLQGKRIDFYFDIVVDGKIPEEIHNFLSDLNTGYCWWWDTDFNLPGGEVILDATTGVSKTYFCNNGQICLTLEEINNPEVVKEANYYNNYIQNTGLFIYNSNHELLEKMKEK